MNTKKNKENFSRLDNSHDADMNPYYEEKKKHFRVQGKKTFIDEFYTLYRKWIKGD